MNHPVCFCFNTVTVLFLSESLLVSTLNRSDTLDRLSAHLHFSIQSPRLAFLIKFATHKDIMEVSSVIQFLEDVVSWVVQSMKSNTALVYIPICLQNMSKQLVYQDFELQIAPLVRTRPLNEVRTSVFILTACVIFVLQSFNELKIATQWMLKFIRFVCIPITYIDRILDFLLAVFLCQSNHF